MRAVVILAAMLAAVALAPQPAEAGERGFGFRHFSPHAGTTFHRPHHGLKLHSRGTFGKHRHFERRFFHHFDRGGLVLKFDHGGIVRKHRHFEPRRFRQFDRGGLVLKFGDDNFVLKFGHVPRFGQRHGHFRLHRRGHFGRSHLRSFALKNREDFSGHLRRFRERVPHSEGGEGDRVHDGAPPEALLQQLEQFGFRDVPELLRKQSR